MKLSFLIIIILILATSANSQLYHPTEKDWATIDVNSIYAWVTDYGSFFRNPRTGNSGFEWPKGGGVSAIYAAGLWVGALVEGEARVVVAEYSYEYTPGTINEETHIANDPYDSTYRVYKIPDTWNYHHWPGKYGAPFTENGEPYLIGDQTLWTVYNDADTFQHINFKSLPLGIEVQQTIFGNRMPPTTAFDFLFIRWLIINKGMNHLDSVNFSIWCDPDLGDSGDDFVGCDTVLNLGYCYNSNNNDAEYGAAPPAVGFQLLQGPIVESIGVVFMTLRFF